jgi:HAD superfamily hydrolase (TIGR01509 family)
MFMLKGNWMSIKALLFDLDGTLTHSDAIHFLAFQKLLAAEGREIDEDIFRRHISGRSNVEVGERLFPERPREDHVLLLDRKEALFRDFADDLVPLAGAIELMDLARRKDLGLALVTNAPRKNVKHMLAAIGAADRFDTIVYGDEMTRPKPDPLPYLTGLEQLDVAAVDALAFEDSIPGVQAAKAAGIFTIGVTTTRTDHELAAAGADLTIADFTDGRLLAMLSDAETSHGSKPASSSLPIPASS